MSEEARRQKARERARVWRQEHKWSVKKYEAWRREWKARVEARLGALEAEVRKLRGIEVEL